MLLDDLDQTTDLWVLRIDVEPDFAKASQDIGAPRLVRDDDMAAVTDSVWGDVLVSARILLYR